MWVRLLAFAALLAVLWTLFRFAIGLKEAKRLREEARREEEGRGRRVVAELPLDEGVLLFLEDDGGFYWGARSAAKPALLGARLLLNGALVASAGAERLPERRRPEAFEVRERWDVALYLEGGGEVLVPCGTVREGVSREAATGVFEAVRRVVESGRR